MSDLDEDSFWRQKPDKKAFVERELARLNTTGPSDPPEVTARKAREAADRLLAHDARFNITTACTIPQYRITQPAFTAGDQEGDDA